MDMKLEWIGVPVSDVDAVRTALAARGVPVSEVQQVGPEGTPGSRFVFFDDPDGNGGAIQVMS